jgi:hypothetical protein
VVTDNEMKSNRSVDSRGELQLAICSNRLGGAHFAGLSDKRSGFITLPPSPRIYGISDEIGAFSYQISHRIALRMLYLLVKE